MMVDEGYQNSPNFRWMGIKKFRVASEAIEPSCLLETILWGIIDIFRFG